MCQHYLAHQDGAAACFGEAFGECVVNIRALMIGVGLWGFLTIIIIRNPKIVLVIIQASIFRLFLSCSLVTRKASGAF